MRTKPGKQIETGPLIYSLENLNVDRTLLASLLRIVCFINENVRFWNFKGNKVDISKKNASECKSVSVQKY